MQPFFSPDRLWPKGSRRLHVYATPEWSRTNPIEGADLHFWPIVDQAREVIADYDCVQQIPGQWLHLTMGAASDFDCDRDTAVETLVHSLRYTPAFKLQFGSPIASNSTILLDGVSFGQYEIAEYSIQDALDEVGGGAIITRPPHMALAYGTGTGDSGAINSQLRRRYRRGHVDWYITRLHIVDVTQHPDASDGAFYQWEVLKTVPLVEDRFWKYPRELECDTATEIWHAARRAHVRYTAATMVFGAVRADLDATADDLAAVVADLDAAEQRLDAAVEPCAAALAAYHGRDLTADERVHLIDHVANTVYRAGLTMPVTDANRARR